MKILSKYITKELTPPFFFGILLFTFIFIADKLFELIDLIITRGVPTHKVMLLILFILPSFIAITIPMSWLLANLMAFGRLSQDNEIIALKSAGKSAITLGKTSLFFSILLSLIMVAFNDRVLPQGNWAFKKLYYNIISKRASIIIQPHVFINEFDNYLLYIDKKNDRTGEFKKIILYAIQSNNTPPRIITAKRGKLISDPKTKIIFLRLYNGVMHQMESQTSPNYKKIAFSSYDIELDINKILKNKATKSLREKSIVELINEVKHKNNKKEKNKWRIEINKRVSIPFACLAFGFIGFPLGMLARKGGKAIGFSMSLLLIFIYYLLLILFQTLGEKLIISPFLATWTPNIIILIIGIFLLYKLLKK